MRPFRSALWAVVLAVAAGAIGAPSPACARDHDEARQAVERGEIRPLVEILAAVRGKLPGEIVRVELERKNGRWLYEFRIVDHQGRVFEVLVDARTAEIVRTQEK